MPDDKNKDINFLPNIEKKQKNIIKDTKEKNVNDNEKLDKLEEKPEKGSEYL